MGNRFITKLALGAVAIGLGAVLTQAAPASPQGFITAKKFLNIGGGTAVADLIGNAKYPNSPDEVAYPSYFELNATGDINVAAPDTAVGNYGSEIVGYFYPPTTGDYVFYIASDDGGNLYLSTNSDPANKKLIAQETGWSNARNYTTIGGGSTVEAKCSITFTGHAWPTTDPSGGAKITLTAGTAYYIQALHKEGGGGDYLSVAVQDPNWSIDNTMPIPGQYLATIDKTTGPLTIVTQPQNLTVDAGRPATFSVVVDGTPPYTYQWKKNGADIAGATGMSYTIARAVYATDNGAKFSVAITGGQGSATSAEATLTVIEDAAAPTLTRVNGSSTFTSIMLTFSEPLDPASAVAAANYTLSGGVTISARTLGAAPLDNIVTLTTSVQPEASDLTLTLRDIKDIAGNTIAPNPTEVVFKTGIFTTGWASYERWHNESGDPGDLAAFSTAVNAGTIRPPDYVSAVTQFGAPWGARDNYSARVSAFFVPPSNGDYVFFTSGDDGNNVYLSTDDKPANKKLIAQETAWSNQYQFTASGGGSDLTAKRSDQFAYIEWPNYNTITLVGGRRYYLEVLMDEGGGGDGVDVTFIKVGDADPANDATGMHLKGSVIGTFLDPNGASVTITEQPANTTQQEERTATFTVATTVTSPYAQNASYQWQKTTPGGSTFTDILGATGASYTTPVLALADNNTKYRVVCSVPTLSVNSAEATLTVVPDTLAPQVVSVGSIMNGTAIELGVTFDENVDPVTAGAVGSYTLSKGTITGVRYQKFAHTDGAGFFKLGTAGPFYGAGVVLTTTGLAAGDTVTVTAKSVKDVKGNTMTATGESKLVTITSKMKWTTIGGNDFLEGELGGQNITPDAALWPEDVVALSESDFDLIGSGTQNWQNYDEATYVYEEITGDFDKVVRVEYHDPTSQWARAGLCATPNPNTGMTRAEVTGGAFMEKRFMLRANPAVQWNGTAGNNQHEFAYRDAAGGNYTSGGGGTPAYPNAWLRMQRVGQAFNAFYSANGKDWTSYGTWTFSTEPMPDKLCVGIYYCPEYLNNATGEGVGHSAVGKFRQYGSFVSNPSVVSYGIGLNFGADEPNLANGGILPSISTAGVPKVLQGNWNNLSGATGTDVASIEADNRGAPLPTAVTVSWTSPNTWASTGRGEENNQLPANDKILMTGYLDTGNASTTTVNINNIPTDLTANGYDVYVYLLGGVAGRGGGYRINSTGGALTPWVDAQPPVNPTAHVEAVPTPGIWATGTYVRFRNLTAANIIVEASTEGGHGYGGTPRASLNAVQLVPASGDAQPPGEMSAAISAGNLTIDWEGDGMLQSATSITGPWTDVGSTKPYTIQTTGGAMFFRVMGQ